MEINNSNSKHSSASEIEMRWKVQILVCSLDSICFLSFIFIVLTVGITQQVFIARNRVYNVNLSFSAQFLYSQNVEEKFFFLLFVAVNGCMKNVSQLCTIVNGVKNYKSKKEQSIESGFFVNTWKIAVVGRSIHFINDQNKRTRRKLRPIKRDIFKREKQERVKINMERRMKWDRKES